MPNLNEFLNNPDKQSGPDYNELESLDGIRPCSKCDLDVDGALWDSNKLLLTWKCSSGHENSIQVG
jgi:hypothetical protein